MNYYVYVFRERIIAWAPADLHRPVNTPETKWFLVNRPPPTPMEEIIANKNMGYNMQRSFYLINRPIPAGWDEQAQDACKRIEILAAFTNLSNTHKGRYTNNNVGQALTDALVLDEIREYRQTGSLENCTILASFAAAWKPTPTPEALVTKLWLGYESYRHAVAYLNQLEQDVRDLLYERKFDDAVRLLNNEAEKFYTL